MDRYTPLPLIAAATLVLGVCLPLVRSFWRDGIVALVPPGSELQRFLHGAFTLTLVGYGGWTLAVALVEPAQLGVMPSPRPLVALGFAVAGAGLALVMLAQAQMGRSWRIGIPEARTELVTHGVFRLSRHPIYLGMMGIALGIALVAPSGWTVMGFALVYVVVGFQARAEDEHLSRQAGDAWVAWSGRVGRFLPRLR